MLHFVVLFLYNLQVPPLLFIYPSVPIVPVSLSLFVSYFHCCILAALFFMRFYLPLYYHFLFNMIKKEENVLEECSDISKDSFAFNCSLATDFTDFLSELDDKYDNTEIIYSDDDILSSSGIDATDRYTCTKCGSTFTNLFHYSFHNKLCYDAHSYSCMECNYQNPSIDSLHLHIHKHAMLNLQCPICHLNFHNSRLFTIHLKIHIIELENELDELMYNEDVTREEFHDYHVDYTYTPIKLNFQYLTSPTKYSCHYCHREQSSKFRSLIHEAWHGINS